MPRIDAHAPGSFCWIEIVTSDPEKARSFYGTLFGWDAVNVPPEGPSFYRLLRHQGVDVAGLYGLPEEMRSAGARPHWLLYVAVDDVAAAVAKAKGLGAAILREATEIPETGRMALLRDPEGAVLALWQAGRHKGFGVVFEAGAPCWFELAVRDSERARRFYRELFGWETRPSQNASFPYWEIVHGGYPSGGILEMTPAFGDAPAHWMVYFTVDDCDAAAKQVEELGGRVCVPPTDIANVGRFAVVNDPQGAVFSVIRITLPM